MMKKEDGKRGAFVVEYIFAKKYLDPFVSEVSKGYEFIAPVKTDAIRFEVVKDAKKINFDGPVMFPAKYLFALDREVLFRYNKKGFFEHRVKPKKRVVFGLRKCDLNAIKHQDILLLNCYEDPYYSVRRQKTVLIGYHCKKGDAFCFCNSMALTDFFDLMFYDYNKKDFAVEIGSDKGKRFIKRFKRFFKPKEPFLTEEDKSIKNTLVLKKKDISNYYEHPDWEKGSRLCVSCAACTILCPTCHCFSIYDKPCIKIDGGERVRRPSSCQLQSFTRVAGDHIFRKERLHRFKHRIYHQLQYFKERYGVNLCTGCGRCIRHCPTKIDFVEIINEMNK